MRPPILGEVSRSEAPRPAGPSTKAFLAIDGLGSVEVILHGAKERGGGEPVPLLDYQTDVRKGRFDKPTIVSMWFSRFCPGRWGTSQGQCCGRAKPAAGGEWREGAKTPKKRERTVESVSVLASAGSI